LKHIASRKGVTLRDSMNAKDKALYDRLSRLSGDAFDKAHMRAIIDDHQQTLEEHFRMAKDTGSQVGVMQAKGNGATAQRQ
jgi:predicted outer membrane protein